MIVRLGKKTLHRCQVVAVELVVNRKAAKALGLTLPRTIMIRADHIIE